jgi:hypothetical protein
MFKQTRSSEKTWRKNDTASLFKQHPQTSEEVQWSQCISNFNCINFNMNFDPESSKVKGRTRFKESIDRNSFQKADEGRLHRVTAFAIPCASDSHAISEHERAISEHERSISEHEGCKCTNRLRVSEHERRGSDGPRCAGANDPDPRLLSAFALRLCSPPCSPRFNFRLKGSAAGPGPAGRPAGTDTAAAARREKSVRISGPRPGRSDPAALGPARPVAPLIPRRGLRCAWRPPRPSGGSRRNPCQIYKCINYITHNIQHDKL